MIVAAAGAIKLKSSRSSSAARARTSCSPTPTDGAARAPRTRSSSTPASAAWPDRGCSCRRAGTTRWSTASPRAPRRSGSAAARPDDPDGTAGLGGAVPGSAATSRPAGPTARRRRPAAGGRRPRLFVEPTVLEGTGRRWRSSARRCSDRFSCRAVQQRGGVAALADESEYGLGRRHLDPRHLQGPCAREEDPRRHGLDQLLQRLRRRRGRSAATSSPAGAARWAPKCSTTTPR